MKATISAKRKGDALITLCQNNPEKRLEVAKMNMAAERLTGYPVAELLGKNFETVLSERVREAVDDNVDFSDEYGDFASVARKIPNFQIVNKEGREIHVSLKVFHLISEEKGKLFYELLMRDVTLIKRMEELKEQLALNDELGAVDEDIDLPTEAAIRSALRIAYSFIEGYPIEVSYATIGIDNITNYPYDVAMQLIKSVADEVKRTVRDEDMVAYLGEGQLGIMLLDCNTDNTKSVIDRVNRNVKAKAIKLIDGTVPKLALSMAYIQILPEYDVDKLLDASRHAVFSVQADGGNKVHAM
jgi:PAS domain S-box-containing protein